MALRELYDGLQFTLEEGIIRVIGGVLTYAEKIDKRVSDDIGKSKKEWEEIQKRYDDRIQNDISRYNRQ